MAMEIKLRLGFVGLIGCRYYLGIDSVGRGACVFKKPGMDKKEIPVEKIALKKKAIRWKKKPIEAFVL